MEAALSPQGVTLLFCSGVLALLTYQAISPADKHVSDTQQHYKLVYSVLPTHLDVTKNAIFQAGGGTYAGGKYKHVSTQLCHSRGIS
jgi:hypothetical protein